MAQKAKNKGKSKGKKKGEKEAPKARKKNPSKKNKSSSLEPFAISSWLRTIVTTRKQDGTSSSERIKTYRQ